MKKNIFKMLTLITFTVMLGQQKSWAQTTNKDAEIAGDPGVPLELTGEVPIIIGKAILSRFHNFDIEGLIYQMRNEGVQEKTFVAAFTAQGAILYNHELENLGVPARVSKKVGKTPGAQLFPFTITITEDNRMFISVAGFAMKNMISAIGEAASINHGGTYDDGFWKVVNNLEVLIFEYDNELRVDNVKTYKLKLASVDLKVSLLTFSRPGTFLAITAGGDIGLQKTVIEYDNEVHSISTKNNNLTAGGNFKNPHGHVSYRYGLELNLSLRKGWRLNGKVEANSIYSGGRNAKRFNYENELYEQELDVYRNEKNEFEMEYNQGERLEPEDYQSLTGKERPIEPDLHEGFQQKRVEVYLAPSLNLSKRITSKDKFPVRVGLGTWVNIPLKDEMTGFKQIDFRDSNRQLLGMKVFINF